MQATTKTANVISTALSGYEGQKVEIECDITNGLPAIVMGGLGTKSVDQAKDRVRSAMTNSGLQVPIKRVTINLAPADLKKDGSSYDLPIAISIMLASGQIKHQSVESACFIGELGLDGRVRPVQGIISHLVAAKRSGPKVAYIPQANMEQARLIKGVELVAVKSLRELYLHLSDTKQIEPDNEPLKHLNPPKPNIDFKDIYGQSSAKRGMEIAAAGGHNILLNGPPGTGKSLISRALPGILPLLNSNEVIQTTNISSLAGLELQKRITQRPFRAPHHTASQIALIGGGPNASPGELSLAHNGVLFLDEIPEFPRHVLEALRQPLEDKTVTVSRAMKRATYPADFMLVATQNPCPCGFLEDKKKECRCSAQQIEKYRSKLSGPLLDRIDLVVRVDSVSSQQLLKDAGAEPSSEIRARVAKARQRQINRGKLNSRLSNTDLKKLSIDSTAKTLLNHA